MGSAVPEVPDGQVMLKTLTRLIRASAMDVTTDVMLDLLDRSPELRRLFVAKNYRREIVRVQRQSINWWQLLDAFPPVAHGCADPACKICRARRVETN